MSLLHHIVYPDSGHLGAGATLILTPLLGMEWTEMTPERGGWWRSVQPPPAINYGPTHSSSFICHLDLPAGCEKAKALCLLDLFALFLKK